jgi:hypothetical protein
VIALALSLIVLAGGDVPAGAEAPAPLTNEDIVRMVSDGTPEREILAAIRNRPEAFDLTRDMIDELTAAGVPRSVLDAMRGKREEAATPARQEERDKPGYGTLVVTLNTRTLRLPAWADEDVKAILNLPKENEQREIKDVAVFLACVSPDHIPDLWRSKSPLGRDMVGARAHQMLAFVAGDTPAGKPPRLTLPARLEANVDLTEPHDLLLGVAALIGDHWVQVGMGLLPGEGSEGARCRHDRRSGKVVNFKVELKAPPSARSQPHRHSFETPASSIVTP